MTNPRHKERHLARNGRDFIDLGLKTMDRVEKGNRSSKRSARPSAK